MSIIPAFVVVGVILWSRAKATQYRLLVLACALVFLALAVIPASDFSSLWNILLAACLVAITAWNLATGGANRAPRRPRYLSQPRCPK